MTRARRACATLRVLLMAAQSVALGYVTLGPPEATRRLLGALRGRPFWRY